MKPKADDEEAGLFREAVRDGKPIAGGSAAPAARRPAAPLARFTREDRLAVLRESLTGDAHDVDVASGDELVFRREGVPPATVRKLRRGQYRVQAEIDLHGLNVAEAKDALRSFLAEALQQQIRCVRIVHGKGLRSGHRGPVLKGIVSGVLRKVGRVLAFVSARQVDGGTGAVYVLLSTWPADTARRSDPR